MSVITISREFGCDGEYVAERIAQVLGYHLVDKEFLGSLLSEYGVVEFAREYDTQPGFWERFDARRERRRDVMVDMLNQVVRVVAHHGDVVIVGRSGFAVLEGFSDVLHLRLQAPFPARVENVMRQQRLRAEEAELLVKESDQVRRAFVEEFYGVRWDAVRAFDLVINTDKISPDLAAALVADAMRAFRAHQETDKPTTRSIAVDPILAAAVSSGLGCDAAHG